MTAARRGARALVAGMLLTASLSGCAADDTGEWLIRVEEGGTIRALAVPGSISIEVGDEVRWSNSGSRVHEITGGRASGDVSRIEDAEIVLGPAPLGPGETLAHRFDEAGVYLFWFGQAGTVGTILVEPKP